MKKARNKKGEASSGELSSCATTVEALEGEAAAAEAELLNARDLIQEAKTKLSEDKKELKKAEQKLKKARKIEENKVTALLTKKRTEALDLEISRNKVEEINKVLMDCIDSRR